MQCLLLVRDDFWMSITRFMKCLEVPQVEGLNSAAVDLFDPGHARKVLRAFGRAFGALPEGEPTAEQERFLDLSVRGLARDGQDRHRPARPLRRDDEGSALDARGPGGGRRARGGRRVVPEETFSAPARRRRTGCTSTRRGAVLEALLPEHGSDIRGRMQPIERLREASGYAGRPDDFRALLQILDGELRLITPTEPDGLAAGAGPGGAAYYQLTHDFLIPALRGWLTAKRRETPRGRAELRLEERTALWTDRRERKQLPSWWEWVGIRALTPRAEWTEPAAADDAGGLAASPDPLGPAGGGRRRRRGRGAGDPPSSSWSSGTGATPGCRSRAYGTSAGGRCPRTSTGWAPGPSSGGTRSSGSPVGRGQPAGPPGPRATSPWPVTATSASTTWRIACSSPTSEEQPAIRGELRRWRTRVAPRLWRHATDPGSPPRARLAAALALADYEPDDARWDSIAEARRPAAPRDRPAARQPVGRASSAPCGRASRRPLIEGVADASLGENRRSLAASLLANFASFDAGYLDAEALTGLVLEATPAQLAILLPQLQRRRDELVDRLAEVIRRRVPLEPDAKNEHDGPGPGERGRGPPHARARRGVLAAPAARPRTRGSGTRLIDRIAPGSPGWEALLDRVAQEKEGSVRQAILIGLEPMGPALSESDRLRAADRLRRPLRGRPRRAGSTARPSGS